MSRLGYVDSEIAIPRRCDLPEDICRLICDAVRDLPRAIAASTLFSLSLVSRSWARPAQTALHHDPFLSFDAPDTIAPRTFERLSALLRTLVARPDLSCSVRKFDLGCYTTRCQTEARVDRRRVSKLSSDLVAACPALKSISLPFVTQADKPYLLDALRKLELLETLVIGEGTSSPDPWVINVDIGIKDAWGCARWFREDFVALSGHWPRLRRLILEARVRTRDQDDERGVPWELEEFRLDLQRHGRLAFEQVDLLLAGSRNGSLRRLHVKEHQLADDALEQLIEYYGSNLRSLTTLTADHFTRRDELFSAIAACCPSLRSRLTLATVIAPARSSPDLAAEVVTLVQNAPNLEELNIALGTHHVTDRGNTIAFARVLADASRTLASSGSKATLNLLPTWGPM
ncbi:hypothetical protein C6P46_002739 [Rhodotorula mucilaginosa]|uniref:F-box domain-containing protein n=1 Tax=Rhodotorula mucilaginosa TaxID=5537 RepID=A0A9P6W5S5_RHOMI|nr:hypothetical protein C6P46_002739 [Rhodotorula mucilaginosa]TKA52475.1 hypothetical protein B0A53_04849 [Rhodotorula sp. CCFEE 5036]